MSTPRLTDLSGELIAAGLEVAGQPGMNYVTSDVVTNWQSPELDHHRRVVAASQLPFPLVEVRFAELGCASLPTDERGMTPVAITVADEAFHEDSRGISFTTAQTLQLEVTTRTDFDFRMENVPFAYIRDNLGDFKGFPPRQGEHILLRTELHVQRYDADRRHQPDGYKPRIGHEPYKPTRMNTVDIYRRDFWAPFYLAYEKRAEALLKRAREVTTR